MIKYLSEDTLGDSIGRGVEMSSEEHNLEAVTCVTSDVSHHFWPSLRPT
jgi:hypothetical protein